MLSALHSDVVSITPEYDVLVRPHLLALLWPDNGLFYKPVVKLTATAVSRMGSCGAQPYRAFTAAPSGDSQPQRRPRLPGHVLFSARSGVTTPDQGGVGTPAR